MNRLKICLITLLFSQQSNAQLIDFDFIFNVTNISISTNQGITFPLPSAGDNFLLSIQYDSETESYDFLSNRTTYNQAITAVDFTELGFVGNIDFSNLDENKISVTNDIDLPVSDTSDTLTLSIFGETGIFFGDFEFIGFLFNLADATGTAHSGTSLPTAIDLDLYEDDKFFSLAFGTPGVGSFTIDGQASPVPVPPALILFVSSMGLLAIRSRTRHKGIISV